MPVTNHHDHQTSVMITKSKATKTMKHESMVLLVFGLTYYVECIKRKSQKSQKKKPSKQGRADHRDKYP